MNELELLEAIELKIALCSQQNLESLVNKVLCPILSKLSSTNDKVKHKVVEILSHLNKRMDSLELPWEKLIDLFHSSGNSVKSFVLIYLAKGCSELLLSRLICGYSKLLVEFQQAVFAILLKQLKTTTTFKIEMQDFRVLSQHFILVMLYYVQSKGQISTARTGVVDNKVNPLENCPRNLSREQVGFITDNLKAAFTFDQQELKNVKLGILNLVSNLDKNEGLEEKFMIYYIGSVDSFSQVSFLADSGLKRSEKPKLDDNDALMEKVHTLYIGTPDLQLTDGIL